MPRRRNASTRILHTIVLPTLGALATACEHNPFVADQPQQVTPPPPQNNQYAVGQTVPLPGVPVVGSTYIPPPGVAPPPPGVAYPGLVAPRPPGVVSPIPGVPGPPPPRPPGVRAFPGRAPPVGSRPAPVLGRAPTRQTDDVFKPTNESPETRTASRRLARMNASDGRDPGCAGAGSIRRRGPA